MKIAAVVLSLAVSGIVLSSALAPASASKMNGKCCQSSDGGRSAAYRWHMSHRAIPRHLQRVRSFLHSRIPPIDPTSFRCAWPRRRSA